MKSNLIVCVGLDLRELDVTMQHLPSFGLKSTRWITTSSNKEELGAFHDFWSQETTVVACLMPTWSPDVEECIDIVVDNEIRPDEQILVLRGNRCELVGALSRHPAIAWPSIEQMDMCARHVANLIAEHLNWPSI